MVMTRLLVGIGFFLIMGCATGTGRQTADTASPRAPSAGAVPGTAGARATAPAMAPKPARRGPELTGTLTTEYLYDRLLSPAPSETTVNQLSEYLTVRWRNSTGPDLKVYFAGSYAHDFSDRRNSRYRIYKLFGEWTAPGSSLALRAGRQPASGNTVFTRFDGLTFTYRPSPLVSLNVGGGFPVDHAVSDHLGIQTDRWFYDAYLMLYDWQHVSGRLYYTQELDANFSMRQAVGLNGYWLWKSVTVTAAGDYDLDFARPSLLLLRGDYAQGPARWSLGAEFRNNPFLDYATALLDPGFCGAAAPVTAFDDLSRQLSRGAIQSCALKNTADALQLDGGVAVDFSTVWRGDLRYAHIEGRVADLSPAGAPAGQRDRRSDRISLFLSERNGLGASEIWSLLVLYEPATDSRMLSVTSTLSKYWQSGLETSLRLRGDRITYEASGSRITRIIPGLLLLYAFPSGTSANLEAEYALEQDSAAFHTNTLRIRAGLTIPF
ncbi:MAG: hypothetical protein AB1515_08695 [Nitrospirota bacterium]